jgi:Tfp pilus assembly protein PilZ
MEKLGFKDRRVFGRFAVELAVGYTRQDSNKKIEAQTHDISAQGIGFVTEQKLTANTYIDIQLSLPDIKESLFAKGRVAWIEKIGPQGYRAGVCLEKPELMGISLVLRSLQLKTRYYS